LLPTSNLTDASVVAPHTHRAAGPAPIAGNDDTVTKVYWTLQPQKSMPIGVVAGRSPTIVVSVGTRLARAADKVRGTARVERLIGTASRRAVDCDTDRNKPLQGTLQWERKRVVCDTSLLGVGDPASCGDVTPLFVR
jgi:hypothetical protein